MQRVKRQSPVCRAGRGRRRSGRVAAVCMAALLMLGASGCESGPRGGAQSGQVGHEEDVKLSQLADPKPYTTLEDLLPEDGSAIAMAVPEGLEQPAIGEGDLRGSQQLLQAEMPSHLQTREELEAELEAKREQGPGVEDVPLLPAERRRATQDGQELPLMLGEASELEAGAAAEQELAEEREEAEARVPRRVRVRLMVFRHPEPRIGRALDMLEGTVPEPDQQQWRANGFAVGQLDRSRLPLFMANLPRELSVDVFTLHRVNRYWPLTLIDRLRGPQHVSVTGPGGTEEVHRLVGGRFQLLFKLVPSFDRNRPRVYLDVLPHHRGVRAELVPRPPQERVLDGKSFESLRLYEPLSTEQAWIIAADLPLEEADSEDDAEDDAADRESAEPEVVNLGRAMLQGRKRQQQVQLLVVITAD